MRRRPSRDTDRRIDVAQRMSHVIGAECQFRALPLAAGHEQRALVRKLPT